MSDPKQVLQQKDTEIRKLKAQMQQMDQLKMKMSSDADFSRRRVRELEKDNKNLRNEVSKYQRTGTIPKKQSVNTGSAALAS